MSLPHTGKLAAIINGTSCKFDGDRWVTTDADLTTRLNDATDSSPKTHYTIDELAKHVLRKSGLLASSKILSFTSDQWDTAIPEDAQE